MNTFLFGVFPYLAMAVFVVGTIWRYKYDKFGWTTRSSQLYESKLLRIGSPLFHYGILLAVLGHAMGLVIPKAWTDVLVPEDIYHAVAVGGGMTAGIMIVVGFVILVFRRRTVKTVFNATTVNDKVMYLVLGLTILFGMWNTISTAFAPEEYHYREGVSPWFRQIFWFQPDASLMENAPLGFQLHAFFAFLLFAMWPFTRLVHVFAAPVGYFVRPYIVYRSRDVTAQHSQTVKGRGWDPIGTRDNEKTRR